MSLHRHRLFTACVALLSFLMPFRAIARQNPSSGGLVLMGLSAHPDDEDGAALAYYAKLAGVKSYSVFFTRGEGGQNEIGPELNEDLARIRTRETLDAASFLGTEVYFLDYPDFGFSKTASETFAKWGGRDSVLERLVYVIRCLKPDVIITTHDTVTTIPNRAHGNHQAVGITVYEAFDKAADSSYHPEHFLIPNVQPWRVKKLFFRSSATSDSAHMVRIDIEKKNPSGTSSSELAWSAFTRHRSQGMDKLDHQRVLESWMRRAYTLIRSDQQYLFDQHDFFSGIEPSVREAGALTQASAGAFPDLTMQISPMVSVLERQDEKERYQLSRVFSVTFTNPTNDDLPIDLSVSADNRKIFYKSYQIPPGALHDRMKLAITKTRNALRQTLRFDALPTQETPPSIKPISATVSLEPIDARYGAKINIGLVKTYDTTIEELLQTFNVSNRLLDSTTLAKGDLGKFTTIILDLRSYSNRTDLPAQNERLLNYVRKGGNIVCFYHKNSDWNGKHFSPYPITLTNERVTQEDAAVIELIPTHPLLNSPNVIRPEDWKGWIQERNIYLPSDDTSQTSAKYSRLLAMSDSGEHQPSTSLLWTQSGKGTYTYVSLALYRQLRILNEGAVRLFFNLISQQRKLK